VLTPSQVQHLKEWQLAVLLYFAKKKIDKTKKCKAQKCNSSKLEAFASSFLQATKKNIQPKKKMSQNASQAQQPVANASGKASHLYKVR